VLLGATWAPGRVAPQPCFAPLGGAL